MSRIIRTDKKQALNDWRETNKFLDTIQSFRETSSGSQSHATVEVLGSDPIAVIALSDLHIGAGGADHKLLERITDEILITPDLYVGLFGDIAEMAIKLRNVAEMAYQSLSSRGQTQYVKSWFAEIAPKVLFATWGNHDIERQEHLTGYSDLADIFSTNVIYFGGIGHLDLTVGEQTYKLALTHKLKGHSQFNPAQGAVRYMMIESPDREVAICGDSHRPGICQFPHGKDKKVAVTSGSLHTDSEFAKRYFSLFTHQNFPVVVFRGDEHHEASPFWSLGEYQRLTGQR